MSEKGKIIITEPVIVKTLQGNVFVINDSGDRVLLKEGQRLTPGSIVVIEDGNFTMETEDHQYVTLFPLEQAVVEPLAVEEAGETKTAAEEDTKGHKHDQAEDNNDGRNEVAQNEDGTLLQSGIVMPFKLELTGREVLPGSGAEDTYLHGPSLIPGAYGSLGLVSSQLAMLHTDPATHGFMGGEDSFYQDSFTVSFDQAAGSLIPGLGSPGSPAGPVQITVTLSGTPAGAAPQIVPPHPAVINGSSTGSVTEDQSLHTGGKLNITDPDPGEDHFLAASQRGSLGTFSINEQGQWSFQADNSNPLLQELSAGETKRLSFTAHSVDGTSHQVVVTVTGTNDDPVLQAQSQSVREDGSLLRGQMTATDVDHIDQLTYSTGAQVDGFALNPDGTYTFDPKDPAYDHLADWLQQVLTIPVTVTDSQGATATQNLQITVTGSNDGPVMAPPTQQTIAEDGPRISGRLSAADPDTGDSVTFGSTAPVHGFSINPDGSWSFDPSHADYQHLGVGQSQVVSIPVTVTDSRGETDAQILQIRVTGTNDGPLMNAVPPQTAAEGGTAVHGQLAATDPDTGDVLTYSHPSPVQGFTLNPDGSYTFDSAHPEYNQLPAGQSRVLTIPVEVRDGHGGSDRQTLQITVIGTDDAPVITMQPGQSVPEDGTVSGQFTATDPDSGDTVTFTAPPIPGLTMNPDGSYTFDATDPAYQHLTDGQKMDLTIPVIATDSQSQADQSELHITVVGTNDVPIVGGIDHSLGAIKGSAGTVHVDGQLSVLDVDDGQSHFQSQLLPGTYGTLAIDSSGHWSYTADANQPALVQLQGQQKVSETFTVTTADGTSHDIQIGITGENTPAAFGGVCSGMVKEDVVGQVSGRMSVMDPDASQSQFIPVDSDTPHGHFTLSADGTWTFTLDNQNSEVNELAESGMIRERITVGSVDGTPHVVTINIVGTNDAPVMNAITAQTATEDGAQVIGQVSSTDVDTGDTSTYSTSAQVDGFTLNPDGSYSFDASHQSYQHLADGEPLTITIPVVATDSQGVASAAKDLVITVTGSNDAPVVSSAASLAAGREDTAVTLQPADLLAHATDVDATDTLGFENLQVDHGTVTANVDGSFTFTPEADYNGPVSFTYDVTDHQGGTVQTGASMDLAAVADAAVIGGALTGTTPDDDTAVSGTMTVKDADGAAEEHFQAVTHQGQYGTFALQENGLWSYTPDQRADAIPQGGREQETFEVHSADGTQAAVTVTVTGSTDQTLTGDVRGAAVEDTTTTISGDLRIVDAGSTTSTTPHFGDHVIAGTYGSLDLRDQGHWIYNLNNQDATVQGLKDGETREDRFSITLPDGTTEEVVVQVTGTHDLPQIQAIPNQGGAEISTATQLTEFTGATDLSMFAEVVQGVPVGHRLVGLYMPGDDHNKLDGMDPATLPTIHDAYKQAAGSGYVYMDTNGWFSQQIPEVDSRAVAPSVRNNWDGGIAVFDDGTIVRLVKVCDGQNASEHDYLYFKKVEGVNANTGMTILSGTATAGQSVEVYEGTTHLGTATADSSGHWQIGVPKLTDGDHTIHTMAGGVSSDPQTIGVAGGQVDIHPTEPLLGTATEDDSAHQQLSGQMQVTDTDIGDNPVFTVQQNTAGTYGIFSIDADGTWHYDLDNSRPATSALPAGQTAHESFLVEVTTASGERVTQTVKVDVQGTNDAPVVSSAAMLSPDTEDTAVTLHAADLLSHATDVDATDSLGVENLKADHGSVTTNADGSFTFTPEPDYNGPVSFTYDVTDHQGGTVQTGATMLLSSVADAATVSGDDIGAVTEDTALTGGNLETSGKLDVTDPDAGEAVFVSPPQSGSHGGHFSIDPDGTWHYTLDNTLPAVQELGARESLSETFTVSTADGTSHDVVVTITGTDDAPVVSSTPQLTTAEDTALHFTAAQLIAGMSDVDGPLSVVDGSVASPHGTISGDAQQGFTFTPDPDFHGDNLNLQFKVTDGTSETDGHAQLDVTPVTDTAAPTLTVSAEQQVMEFQSGSASGVVNQGNLAAGGVMHGITIDMTILGGQQVASSGGHGATLLSYATPSDTNHMYVWNDAPGRDLTFRVGGNEYATGVPMETDGHDHRYTFVWDGTTGTLDVLVDGQVEAHMENVGKGATIADGGKIALGNDQDSFGGTFSVNDAFTGQVFNVAVAKTAMDPAQLATGSVANLLKGDAKLLTNVMVDQNGQFHDSTGNYQYQSVGTVIATTVEVDTAIAPPNPGATLKLGVDLGTPTDTDDQIVEARLLGLPDGTVVSDGHGHTATIDSSNPEVDIHDWDLTGLTATPPGTYQDNMRIGVAVVTEGPDGTQAEGLISTPVVLDPTQPVPDEASIFSSPDEQDFTETDDITMTMDGTSRSGADADGIDGEVTADIQDEHHDDFGFVAYEGVPAGGTGGAGLAGLVSEEPTLNFDNVRPQEKGAEPVSPHAGESPGSQSVESQNSPSASAADTAEEQTDSDRDADKKDTKDESALQTGDILQDEGEGSVDDLLSQQPEKDPVAVEDTTAGKNGKDMGSDVEAKEDDAAAPDSAALDSTLVDAPDDHSI